MNKEIMDALKELASKLGTTVEYLWSVLMKQAAVDATITLAQVVIVFLISFFVVKKMTVFVRKDKDGYRPVEDDEGLGIVACIVASIFLVFAFFFIVVSINDIVTGYLNPEYWALHKILDTLKGDK